MGNWGQEMEEAQNERKKEGGRGCLQRQDAAASWHADLKSANPGNLALLSCLASPQLFLSTLTDMCMSTRLLPQVEIYY